MDISVVVPTYRRPRMLAALLDSLRGQETGFEWEVVVVDDGSGPDTTAVLEGVAASWPRLRWETQAQNGGPAAARNRGVVRSSGRWILFLDDDMVAPAQLVERHGRYLEAGDPAQGVVGRVEWAPGLAVTAFMSWLDAGDVQFDFASLSEGPVVPAQRAFYTCNVSLGRDLFERAGGFDERFRYAAYEDTELAARLSRLGFHLDYRPTALAWHARPIELTDFAARMEKVGEAAVLLSRLHPDLAEGVDLLGPRATGGRRWIRRLITASGPLLARTPWRARYYQAVVNDAFCRGVDRA